MRGSKMALKCTEQHNKILVRRWKYCAERKRSLPTTVFTTCKWRPDSTLPESVIGEFDVTEDELRSYEKYISERVEKDRISSEKYALKHSDMPLEKMIKALDNPDACDEITIEMYERMSELLATAKKAVTRNKQALKRKLKRS
jgi:hypothetical protein